MNSQIKKTLEFVLSKIHFVVIPVILCTLLAVFAAVFGARHWSASQALFIRDDSIGSVSRGGRFDSVDMMQVSQETILQIAKSPSVLKPALESVGKESSNSPVAILGKAFGSSWPTEYDVEDLGRAVSIKSPKGTQFGRTEVIYVSVKASSQERAGKLARAISEQLGKRMMKLREERYSSVSRELEEAVDHARRQLAESSQKLKMAEKRIGADLSELRTMLNGGQGEGTVRRVVVQLEGELRGAQAAYSNLQSQIKQFTVAANNPSLMLSIPNALLNNQPSLRRLKEGLSEAQIRTSMLLGARSPKHPDVVAAKKSEDRVRAHLHAALVAAVGGLKTEVRSAAGNVHNVTRQLSIAKGRLGGVAGLRTEYDNLNSEVAQCVEILKNATSELAVARSNELSARSVSLIHLVDQPVIGTKPLGMGRVTKVLAGVLAGCMIGGCLIFLMMPVADTEEEPKEETRKSPKEEFERDATQRPGRGSSTERRSRFGSLVSAAGERRGSALWSFRGRRLTDHPGVHNATAGRREADTTAQAEKQRKQTAE